MGLTSGISSLTTTSLSRLGTEVIRDFIAIDPETQQRNVTAWTPVVTDILLGCIGFEDAAVSG